MGTGILICGLNGAGKSTLGKALAERCKFRFIDAEELYFTKTDPQHPYGSPRSREEVEKLLHREMKAQENFVFASVKGDYGEAIFSLFQYAIWLRAPKEIRMQRVRNRSFQKFGNRMLPGGDLYEQEEGFFRFVQSREETTVEEWAHFLRRPVLQVDGTKPVEENVTLILEQIPI